MFNLPKLIGHRGVRNLSPENTTDSVKLAKDLGLNWVEIDVKITKDLIPILLHDDSLERTTNGKGLPVDYNYNELKSLDAGYFFNNQKTPIHIPTLEEILHLSQIHNINLNIELKPNKNYEDLNIKKVLEEIKKSSYDKIYFSSFNLSSCIGLKESAPHLLCGFLNDDFNKVNINETIDICKKYNFFSCGINLNFFSNSIVSQFVENEIQVTVYSDNNISELQARNLWNSKVTSIFVDDPSEYL